jgi:MFS-type transporter involved in bile tolerance (Atg22 family)
MKPEGKEHEEEKKLLFKKWWFWTAIISGIIMHLLGSHGFANFLLFMMILAVMNRYIFNGVIHYFQNSVLPNLMNKYEKLLKWNFKRGYESEDSENE